jgi:hypothetical protein
MLLSSTQFEPVCLHHLAITGACEEPPLHCYSHSPAQRWAVSFAKLTVPQLVTKFSRELFNVALNTDTLYRQVVE